MKRERPKKQATNEQKCIPAAFIDVQNRICAGFGYFLFNIIFGELECETLIQLLVHLVSFFNFFLNHEQCDAMRWALHSSKNWLNATITIPINCCNSLYAPKIITLSLNAIISTLQLSIWTNHKNLNTQFTNATFICSLLLTQTTVW